MKYQTVQAARLALESALRDMEAAADAKDMEKFHEAERQHILAGAAFDTLSRAKSDADKSAGLVAPLDAVTSEDDSRRTWRSLVTEATSRSTRMPDGAELVYHPAAGHSFILDAMAARNGDGNAIARLAEHTRQMEALGLGIGTRAIGVGAGVGGEFVPPLYALAEQINVLRNARPVTEAMAQRPTPTTGMTIEVPKVTQGTTVAAVAEAGTVVSQDLVTDYLDVPIRTFAGQIDGSVQLRDRSPIDIDAFLYRDLLEAYAAVCEVETLNGTGVAPHIEGLLRVTGINAVTYTDASPVLMGAGKMYTAMAKAASKVGSVRLLPPQAIIMAPRRWGWMLAEAETSGRPFILSQETGPTNAAGALNNIGADMVVGRMLNLPVLTSAGLPLNLGGGTEDAILVVRFDDLVHYEDTPRFRIFEELLSGTLQVRWQLYNYNAVAVRYASAISAVTGTGLAAPAGF